GIDGSYIFYRLLDFLQMITLFGTCMYLVLRKNRENYGYLFLEMIIIGGFVFHTVWEAKGQYTILYYILFIPIAIRGYAAYANKYNILVTRGFHRENADENVVREYRKKRYKALLSMFIIILATVAGVLLFSFNGTLNAMVNTDRDTEEYAQYVAIHRYDDIKDGLYRIHPAKDASMSLTVGSTEDVNRGTIYMSEDDFENNEINIKTIYDRVYIQFTFNELYLDLYNGNEDNGAYVNAYKSSYSGPQQWGVIETGTGSYYMRIGKKSALTYDEDSKSVVVKEFDYLDSQEWILERVDEK
ncbi:MAG: RICIN domain-containing protein, partial [Lachnospiraceae bacterium]|nr:RICIN domain-containing protein [Lachnospiraceae bacterium]